MYVTPTTINLDKRTSQLTGFEFSIFAILTKNVFYNFLKWINKKAPTGFELMTYIFLVNALIHCAKPYGNKIGK